MATPIVSTIVPAIAAQVEGGGDQRRPGARAGQRGNVLAYQDED
jgi:hypothetical protein